MQFAGALVLSQLLAEYITDESKDVDTRRRVFDYFGTFTNALLSMFEISLANWVISCRLLYTQVDEIYGAIFVIYRCALCFAVVKVITAVFIAQTNKAAAQDEELVFKQKQKEQAKQRAKLLRVFKELDETGSGMLAWDDWKQLQDNQQLRTILSGLEISTHDLEMLFRVLDEDRNGCIDTEEFVARMAKIKGPAKSMDLLAVHQSLSAARKKIEDMEGNLRPLMYASSRLESKVDSLTSALPSFIMWKKLASVIAAINSEDVEMITSM
eukprot:gnl/TRDRNA2_/TRDRNA2_164305_c1_seq2.p1 gnl/TRDRNA2_/TRDRNA2_164305_c1~~gnl/TRDRNA2_/TRDRNA2_164305_c1_seq2.p1  ORF type:complete len:269 (+),score=51.56 gnl/TRDRNA2_/TRDRNA2_164305_c1_seq2:95-901(+)